MKGMKERLVLGIGQGLVFFLGSLPEQDKKALMSEYERKRDKNIKPSINPFGFPLGYLNEYLASVLGAATESARANALDSARQCFQVLEDLAGIFGFMEIFIICWTGECVCTQLKENKIQLTEDAKALLVECERSLRISLERTGKGKPAQIGGMEEVLELLGKFAP